MNKTRHTEIGATFPCIKLQKDAFEERAIKRHFHPSFTSKPYIQSFLCLMILEIGPRSRTERESINRDSI